MKRHLITLFCIFWAGTAAVLAQIPAPISTIEDVTVCASSAVVPIRVQNFTDIGALDLKISFDKTIASLSEITFGTGVVFSGWAVNHLDLLDGIINCGGYFDAGTTLADGGVLLYLHFDRVNPGTSPLVFIDDEESYGCLFYNSASEALDDTPTEEYYFNGSVTFYDNSHAPVTTIPQLIACPGQTVTFPVTVTQFCSVGAGSFTLKFDPSVLANPVFENTSNIIPFGFNADTPGTIRISAFSDQEGGHTLPEGSVLYTLKFTYLGGTSALSFYHPYTTTCQYGGPPPNYPALYDNPKGSYFINGGISPLDPPAMTCPTYDPVLVSAEPFELSGGIPDGGVYSGDGVTQSGTSFVFDPQTAGVGTHTITYSVNYGPSGQSLVGYWSFNDTGISGTIFPAIGGSPTSISPDSGTGTFSIAGWGGGASAVTGTDMNVVSPAVAGTALSLSSASASGFLSGNDTWIQIQTSMTGLADPVITYALSGNATGYDQGTWSYSTDGTNFTDYTTIIPTNDESFELRTVTFSGVTDLNNAPVVYFRYTLDGASAAGGNNIIDNLQINATQVSNCIAACQFTITVNQGNLAPELASIGDQTVNEHTSLTFTATATDPNSGDVLTFSLVGEPEGAVIDPVTGVFTWTPTEVQGPGSYTVTVQVCDDGSPSLCDEETITITVNEVNVAPVLEEIGNKTVDELTELTFTASATDGDIPANTLTFSLTGAPEGASINSSTGVFSWIPTEAQGPGSYTVTVQVCDDGSPSLCDEETITITVNEVNTAPTISCPGNILDNTDGDVCTALVSGIATPTYSDPDDNIVSVTWTMNGATTDVSQQTGINILTSHTFNIGTTTVTYRVTDAGGLSEECSFTVTVIDNQNPTIECPSSVTVSADANSCTASGVTLGTATFSDNCTLPSNALTNDAPSVFPLGTTVVIWTVTDGAGLTSTCSQLVTVLDNQNPQLVDVPSGGDLGCNPGLADLPACDPGVTATDNCGTATVQCTPGDVIEDGCDRSQTFTYSAKDAFGNEASATVTYTWKVDNTPPVISNLPAGGDLGCNPGLADLPACSLNVMATDNCDGAVNVTCTAGAVTDVGTCGKSQVFSYYAVDACGNGATETVTYTWTIDTTPPDLTVSDNVDLGCNPTTDAIDAAKAAITASAEDNCGGPVTITYNDISGTNGCEIAFGRIFTAFDGCGNAVSKTVSIGWKTDTTAPVFTGCPTAVIDLGRNPADLPDCGDALALVSVSDHCSGAVTPSCQAGSIEQSGLQFTQTFTLRATDACNNVATCTVTYTWNIQECMPYFSDCPEEPIDLGCNPELPDCDDAKAVAGTVYDGCGGTLTPSCARGTIEENGCLRTQDFVLTAVTDDGTAICTVTYTWIESLDKPVIATTAVSGDKGCNPTIVTPEFTLVQACTPGSIVVTTNGVQGTGCAKSQTWKANFTDACLKKADEVVITYTWTEDLVKPVIATTAVSGDKGCNPTIVAPVFTLSEACSPGEIVVTTDGVQGTGCAKSQTWKANFTDACQNKADEVVVTWTWTEDLVKPVIVTTAESGDKGCNPTIVAPVFTLTEACSPGSIVVTTGGVQGTGCAKSQTWKANFTDACLNKADEVVVTYTWTEDVTAPVITCPDDKTLIVSASGTSADWTAETPTASDNCTASSTLTVTGVRSDGKALTDPWPLGTTTITWTAADECENISAPCEQTVTVIIGCLTIDAKVYLEGALINPVTSAEYTVPMRTTLNDLQMLPGQAYQDGANVFYTPSGQPYNTEPWNYDGAEGSLFDTGGSVGNAGYPATVVDWVLVSLRNTAGAGYQKICEKAALLLSDGTIEMLEGFDCCDLDMNGSYYLVVEHRNHLLVMSHVPVQVVAGTLTYDFTAQQSYILPGSGLWGQKEVDGIFFMFGGNGNQSANADSDTDINADDQSTWESHNGRQGYRSGDYNLNGDTNSNDRIIWERNNGHGTSVIRNY